MKKASLYIALFIMMVVVLASCTRNHGDIGIWFGTWHVEQITANGTPVNVEGDYFFQFQNKVFRVSQVYGHENIVESFGTWHEHDGGHMMTVDFPDPDVFYIIMPGLEVHNDFLISTVVSSSELIFTKNDITGVEYTFKLKRQP